ncbi:MAG: succinate dehydrogenase assembly factor 2 [Sphingomonadaceae bacterium]|nr:succinate dehydrogenase assembly factor 2 [Sphingomonadaceae bacterium]
MPDLTDLDFRRRRLSFRAWHRGTREADLMIGGFAEKYAAGWGLAEIDWFEALLDSQDVDIMAWAIGKAQPPEYLQGEQMAALQRLDYVAKAMR